VELDGGQHAVRAQADAARTRRIELEGYRLIRFWNNEVLGNIDGVLHEIAKALTFSPPARGRGRGGVAAQERVVEGFTPNPSRTREGR